MELKNDALQVLKKLVDAADKIHDHFLISYNLNIRGDVKKRICDELQMAGYISKVEHIGQCKIQCFVTDKAFDLIKTRFYTKKYQ